MNLDPLFLQNLLTGDISTELEQLTIENIEYECPPVAILVDQLVEQEVLVQSPVVMRLLGVFTEQREVSLDPEPVVPYFDEVVVPVEVLRVAHVGYVVE